MTATIARTHPHEPSNAGKRCCIKEPLVTCVNCERGLCDDHRTPCRVCDGSLCPLCARGRLHLCSRCVRGAIELVERRKAAYLV